MAAAAAEAEERRRAEDFAEQERLAAVTASVQALQVRLASAAASEGALRQQLAAARAAKDEQEEQQGRAVGAQEQRVAQLAADKEELEGKLSAVLDANAALQERVENEEGDKQDLLDFVQVCEGTRGMHVDRALAPSRQQS